MPWESEPDASPKRPDRAVAKQTYPSRSCLAARAKPQLSFPHVHTSHGARRPRSSHSPPKPNIDSPSSIYRSFFRNAVTSVDAHVGYRSFVLPLVPNKQRFSFPFSSDSLCDEVNVRVQLSPRAPVRFIGSFGRGWAFPLLNARRHSTLELPSGSSEFYDESLRACDHGVSHCA